MEVTHKIADLRQTIARWRAEGKTIAFVPTMGALHDGHLSLVREAQERCDYVVVSIFVNPLQFAAGEDLSRYPRMEDADKTLLTNVGVSLAFLPLVEEIYPAGFATQVQVAGISDLLCGQFRPGHFTGVATIVAKLLLQVLPDCALFGEKDYQQLAIIRRMVADLNIPVEIIGQPTIREEDGLAMSSRNRYLSPEQRQIAAQLYRVLHEVKSKLLSMDANEALSWGREALMQAGFDKIDYLELCDAETLAAASAKKPARLLAAVFLGTTRLIDNIPIEPSR